MIQSPSELALNGECEKMKSIKILFLLTGVALLTGCVSTSGQMSSVNRPVYKPTQRNQSLVVFVRPSLFGGMIQSTVYDGSKYIGTLSAKTQIAYQTRPGKHLFMVIAESADFMRANLLANKTYYVEVAPYPGLWKARFAFRPQNGQISKSKFDGWLAESTQVKINQQGLAWHKAHAADIQAKRDEYLPKWESKREANKQMLKASSGR